MSKTENQSDALFEREAANMDDHLSRYLRNGEDGHIFDTSHIGGRKETTTLLLKTIGRKSGRPFITPLIYIHHDDAYVIIASKAGADTHPAWYLNIREQTEVIFQVADERFAGAWTEVEGAERDAIYEKAAQYFPPYRSYQAETQRRIPVILLTPNRTVETL